MCSLITRFIDCLLICFLLFSPGFPFFATFNSELPFEKIRDLVLIFCLSRKPPPIKEITCLIFSILDLPLPAFTGVTPSFWFQVPDQLDLHQKFFNLYLETPLPPTSFAVSAAIVPGDRPSAGFWL